MSLSIYLTCISFGFGISISFAIVFYVIYTLCFKIKKLIQYKINPWRYVH
jgi:hypothetical protein